MSRRKSEELQPRYLSTYKVAALLGVSAPTVVNWCNAGRIIAHRTPGHQGHRRISREDLIAFCKGTGLPVPSFDDRPERSPQSSSTKVLVVDNDRDFCDVVKDYLMIKEGYEVEVADSGFAAGLIVGRFRPHVILMDIHMDGKDGFEALRMLQDDPGTASIPVIACSAPDPRIEERVRREAFIGFIAKPLQLKHLAGALKNAVNGKAFAPLRA
jgi:excisionase family DNA binding protein